MPGTPPRAHLGLMARPPPTATTPGSDPNQAELLDAWESGVPVAEGVPVGGVGGLEYFDDVSRPAAGRPDAPTGGVGCEVSAYLNEGAVAVGLSGAGLCDTLLSGACSDRFSRKRRAGSHRPSRHAHAYIVLQHNRQQSERRQRRTEHPSKYGTDPSDLSSPGDERILCLTFVVTPRQRCERSTNCQRQVGVSDEPSITPDELRARG